MVSLQKIQAVKFEANLKRYKFSFRPASGLSTLKCRAVERKAVFHSAHWTELES